MGISRQHIQVGWRHFWQQLAKVIRNPLFLILTLIGNFVLFAAATLFYFLETGVNPKIIDIYDSLWWAFVTMTTVGYGDIIPMTGTGRVIAVFLMLTGGVLFLSFIALLSSAFIELEFLELEKEVVELRKKISTLSRDIEKHH